MNLKFFVTRNSFRRRLLVLAVATFAFIASAFATPSVNIAPKSMFRPRGMVRVQLTPGGPVDYWVGDGAQGFCRLDNGILNIATCTLNGTSEPFDDRPNSPYVFLADAAGTGVNRVTFGPDPNNPGHSILASLENVLGAASGVTFIGAPGAKLRAESAKIGPDGLLYVVFQHDGSVVRVTNPRDPRPPSPLIQRASIVAASSNNKRYVSMTFIGNDFWGVQAGFAERIQNITGCLRVTLACTGQLQYQNIQFPMGMASDGVRFIYFSSGVNIIRLDTTVPGLHQDPSLMQIWSRNGILNGRLTAYSLPRGVNIHPANANFPGDPGGDMFITDDLTIEAPAPGVPTFTLRTGRAWLLATPVTAEVCPTPTNATALCTITSPVGTGTPLTPNARQATAATMGILRVTGVTHPRGLVFLGTHFWVADEALGVCRIDPLALGAAALTNCFKPNPAFIPGQIAADKNSIVYVPDISNSTGGITRLVFDPVSQTLSQSGVLSQGRGLVAAAVAVNVNPLTGLTDLYIGPTTGQQITKIVSAATAPSAAQNVASTFLGQGVRSMVFHGTDLYLMEPGAPDKNSLFQTGSGQPTIILNAAPDLSRGHAAFFSGLAQFVGGSGLRTLVPPTDMDTPAALALGPTGQVPCNTIVRTFDPATPSLYLGGATEVDQWSFLCSKDTLWTAEGELAGNLNLKAALGVVTALGFAPDGTLAIGDDPSLLPLTAILTATTLSPSPGQGHVYVVSPQ
ncbi:MAG TPA: hypothetical protein VFR84_07125 [Candidatus Angelobacter sp.]|nr:hypothetical protein [Candidatus Angelobacter sp.]